MVCRKQVSARVEPPWRAMWRQGVPAPSRSDSAPVPSRYTSRETVAPGEAAASRCRHQRVVAIAHIVNIRPQPTLNTPQTCQTRPLLLLIW